MNQPLPSNNNEEKCKEWNEAISPRLEAMRSWFSGDEWNKGMKAYLHSVMMRRREHLEEKDNDALSDQFIKGQIAMLKEIMAIPLFIEQQIQQVSANKSAGPRGDAGY